MTDTPGNAQDPFAAPPLPHTDAPATGSPVDPSSTTSQLSASPAESLPPRRGLGTGAIIAIVVAGVFVAGAIVTASLVFSARDGDVVAQSPASTPSASASPSESTASSARPSAAPTDQRTLSATGEVPFAGGKWALYIPASWGPSPGEDTIVGSLPDGVEVVGVWQVSEDPNDLAFVGALPARGASDKDFEETAKNASVGIKIVAADSSTSEPTWSTTVGGYRQVTVVTNAILEDESTATQAGAVIILGDTAIYIVATSYMDTGANGAVQTIANGIE